MSANVDSFGLWNVAHGLPVIIDGDPKEAQYKQALVKLGRPECDELALAFMRARKMTPESPREITQWRAALLEMRARNTIKPEHVTEAVQQITKSKLTCSSPWSVINIAKDISCRPEQEPTKPKGMDNYMAYLEMVGAQ